jgi:hypothetical protein
MKNSFSFIKFNQISFEIANCDKWLLPDHGRVTFVLRNSGESFRSEQNRFLDTFIFSNELIDIRRGC